MIDVLNAQMELLSMDIAFGRGRDILVEVSKAVTVAQSNPDVEAKVVCKNVVHFCLARASLGGDGARKMGLKWNKDEQVWELPNGSAVRVVLETKP